ncbi:antitoxin Xre-like helix-turn-helix domain-containing protein [Pseudomonas sp. OTU5201]|uniref:antitoxin Xre-like helix-turn-helix domain-containing protein n=1 Tax=Pseudomonas sp. OTU5201 TaxID=3043850 RepID=UPI00313BF1C9
MTISTESELLILMGGSSGDRLDSLVRTGAPLEAVEHLARRYGISAVSAGIITARTLRQRHAKGQRLSRDESDRLYRVSTLLLLAEKVFADPTKATLWLSKRQSAFCDRTPLEAAATTPGFTTVQERLAQLDEGYSA